MTNYNVDEQGRPLKNDTALDQQLPSWDILPQPAPKGGPRFREVRRFLIPIPFYRIIEQTHAYIVSQGVKVPSEQEFLLAILEAGINAIHATIAMKEAIRAANQRENQAEAGNPEGQDGDRQVPGDEVRAGSGPEGPAPESPNEGGEAVHVPSGGAGGLDGTEPDPVVN